MIRNYRPACAGLAVTWLVSIAAVAVGQPPQKKAPDLGQMQNRFRAIQWQNGPTTGKIGGLAEVKVPAGYKYAGREGLLVLLDLTQNPSTDRDLGVICPQDYDLFTNPSWFLTFEWDGIGRVEDKDRNNLDGAAILQSLQQSQEADNRNRTARGFPTLSLLGWAKAPFYDPDTNLLTWATRIGEGGAPNLVTVNYNSRILGREGVLSANLVIDEHGLDRALPNYRTIVKGVSYVPGKRYAEWREGDKVAGYGLAALVTGGAAAAAAKSGLLGKLGKGIIYVVVAAIAGISALFKKIFGGGSKEEPTA